MGILNITPDSFSDGGRYFRVRDAVAHAEQMLLDGAEIIDIGAESTRPGAQALSVNDELARLLPVLKEVLKLGKPVSVDTTKPEVMQAVLEAGAAIINDVNALQTPGALEVVAKTNCGICLMHRQGQPGTMQANPQYQNVVAEVHAFLLQRAQTAQHAGIAAERLCLDPGFGFGKRPEHNLALLQATTQFVQTHYPVLIGISRKSMVGYFTGKPDSAAAQRLGGSIAAALFAVGQGAQIIRVHDVRETVEALRFWQACQVELPAAAP